MRNRDSENFEIASKLEFQQFKHTLTSIVISFCLFTSVILSLTRQLKTVSHAFKPAIICWPDGGMVQVVLAASIMKLSLVQLKKLVFQGKKLR